MSAASREVRNIRQHVSMLTTFLDVIACDPESGEAAVASRFARIAAGRIDIATRYLVADLHKEAS